MQAYVMACNDRAVTFINKHADGGCAAEFPISLSHSVLCLPGDMTHTWLRQWLLHSIMALPHLHQR